MLGKLTPEKIIYRTWLSVAMTFCWPLPLTSTKKQLLGYKLLQIGALIHVFIMLLLSIYSSYLHLDDIVVLSKSLCITVAISQPIIQTVVCFVKHNVLQRVVAEMVTCIKESQQFERDTFFDYITKCRLLYGCALTLMYSTAAVALLGPTVLPIPFPYDVKYPFNIDYTPTYVILYLQQSFFTFQCTAHVCLSGFGALLLWFSAARFENLAVEFQKCSDIDKIITCVNKQLHLRRYAEDVIGCFRIVVLYAIAVGTFVMILCGLLLIVNSPMIVKIQFIFVWVTILLEVYMYVWPANYMADMSVNASRSAYNVSWYEHTLDLQKNLLHVLVYQKPVIFSISCIVPELSLRYYCSYLSNAFSIFACLRVAIQGD